MCFKGFCYVWCKNTEPALLILQVPIMVAWSGSYWFIIVWKNNILIDKIIFTFHICVTMHVCTYVLENKF